MNKGKLRYTPFKMWLGELPLLTKGPFALMYGGQDIINQVKQNINFK